MEINITTGYKIFEKHYDRIAESLGASNALGHELEGFIEDGGKGVFGTDLDHLGADPWTRSTAASR